MNHSAGEGGRAVDGMNTSLSPLFSAMHKKMSFWLDTKEPLYPPPLLHIGFSLLRSFFLFSLFPLSPLIISLSLCFSLWKRYFLANDFIRGAIWNSITEDFIVATAIWMEGSRDGWRQRCVNVYFLWPLTGFDFFYTNNNLICVACFT